MSVAGRPGEWTICARCEGHGKSSAYLGVIRQEEWDQDEVADYFAGKYDRSCDLCKGSGKLWIDTGPCIAGVEDDEVCPCNDCQIARDREDYNDRRMRWYEDGCPEGSFSDSGY